MNGGKGGDRLFTDAEEHNAMAIFYRLIVIGIIGYIVYLIL